MGRKFTKTSLIIIFLATIVSDAFCIYFVMSKGDEDYKKSINKAQKEVATTNIKGISNTKLENMLIIPSIGVDMKIGSNQKFIDFGGWVEKEFPDQRPMYIAIHRFGLVTLTPEQKIFTSTQALVRKEVEGGVVQIIKPTTGYNGDSLMVVAGDNSFLKSNNDSRSLVPVLSIHDYPTAVRLAYYEEIFALLSSFEDFYLNHNDPTRVIAVENAISQISNSRRRVSRSIAVPHTQIFSLWNNIKQESKPSLPYHQYAEREFIRRLILDKQPLIDIETGIRNRLPENLSENFKILARFDLPYGYAIIINNINHSNILEKLSNITKILSANHESYTLVSRNLAEQILYTRKNALNKLLIEQPSYRSFSFFENDKLVVIFSPAFVSSTGVVESLGVNLMRGPNYPKTTLLTDSEEAQSKIIASVKMKIN